MKKTANDLTVPWTVSVSPRPVADPAFGVVHASGALQCQGTGMPSAGSDVTPRERINPSGTTTWSPPV